MKRSFSLLGYAALLAAAGCLRTESGPTTTSPTAPADQPPVESRSVRKTTAAGAGAPELSWDTERDRKFAEFLAGKSGGMIRKAAVGIDRRGELRIELDRSVAPEDTLDLTKSVMAGARRDFPDRPILLSVYDPTGAPILKAHYRPGEGVQYKIAHGGSTPTPGAGERPAEPEAKGGAAADPLARSGVTEADRKFAAWAEDHGRAYLRYVEADLERHGRLWFGVNRNVKPADVPELTKSLLEGAQKEFPRRDLVATVFDPDGERIGKAHLGSDGRVRWEK
jgi:hypothetical protein